MNHICYDLKRVASVMLAMFAGGVVGAATSMFVIMIFCAIIMTPFMNIYYAFLWFLIGSVYLYRMLRKNKIALPNDTPSKNEEISSPDMEFTQPETGNMDDSKASDNTYSYKEFFRRPPLVTDTKALYQASLLFSDPTNDKINKLNFCLELTLTFFIFASGILTLTLEKDWWGGEFSAAEHSSAPAHNYTEWVNNGYKLTKPNPAYLVENMMRLMVVGTSISFFVIMSFLELFQNLLSCLLAGKGCCQSICDYIR